MIFLVELLKEISHEFTFLLCAGKFQEGPDQPAARFLRVSHTMDGDMTTSESVKFDWPRYVYLFNLNHFSNHGVSLSQY